MSPDLHYWSVAGWFGEEFDGFINLPRHNSSCLFVGYVHFPTNQPGADVNVVPEGGRLVDERVITDLCKLIGMHSLAAARQLELFSVDIVRTTGLCDRAHAQ